MLKIKKEYLEAQIAFPKKSGTPGWFKFQDLTEAQLRFFVQGLKNDTKKPKNLSKYFDNTLAEIEKFLKGEVAAAKVEKPVINDDVDVVVEIADEETKETKKKASK